MSTISILHRPRTAMTTLRGPNRKAMSGGMTVLMLYLFVGLPVEIGVLGQLGITGPEAASWFFITWLTTGAFSLFIALQSRQPVSINLSIPV